MKAKWLNKMRAADRCPEEAGVGGSNPSLATTSFHRLSGIFVPTMCLTGVQMESKWSPNSVSIEWLRKVWWHHCDQSRSSHNLSSNQRSGAGRGDSFRTRRDTGVSGPIPGSVHIHEMATTRPCGLLSDYPFGIVNAASVFVGANGRSQTHAHPRDRIEPQLSGKCGRSFSLSVQGASRRSVSGAKSSFTNTVNGCV